MVVVEGGKCPTPCKKRGGIVWEGEMPVNNVRGEYILGGNIQIPLLRSDSQWINDSGHQAGVEAPARATLPNVGAADRGRHWAQRQRRLKDRTWPQVWGGGATTRGRSSVLLTDWLTDYECRLTRQTSRRHFQWPWTTPNPDFNLTSLLDAEHPRNGMRHSYNGILKGTHTWPTQGCHFEWSWVISSDLAKYSMTRSGLSATAQLLVSSDMTGCAFDSFNVFSWRRRRLQRCQRGA